MDTNTEEIIVASPKKSNGLLISIISIIIVAIICGGVAYGYQAKNSDNDQKDLQAQIDSLKSEVALLKATPTKTSTDESASWKTLSSTKNGFSLKYPKELTAASPSMTGEIDENTSDFTLNDASSMLFEIKVISANEFQGTNQQTIDYVSLSFNDYVNKLWQANKANTNNPDGSVITNKEVTAITNTEVGGKTAKKFDIGGAYIGPDESTILYSASKTQYGTHTYYLVENGEEKIQIHFPTDYTDGEKIVDTITFK